MAKNIILLSDGTGNSSSNPFKTNVWRLYQAIDISAPASGKFDQIVYYDNGVGTESFKPLAIMGLAIGLGLATNVKNLYTFLCRNYQPGDNIYLFGFSRGAFTVRILAGLVFRCGLVKAPDEDELEERIKHAYAEFKRDMARRATATRPWLIAGQILGGSQKAKNTDRIVFNFPEPQSQLFPRITFMGVWDTVDAYGMPVDELKEGIDRYVWPMTVADRELSDHVDRVCHALSLDDERPTFRPVLWTDPKNRPERLTQVWFSGVHANVGGGYPDDGLAYVAQQWIMDEAAQSGMRFYKDQVDECNNRADVHGEEYDSRSGIAGYYRYGPRDVDGLCDDPDHGVSVAHPKIHDSVLRRIGQWQVAYAPISFPRLPRGYEIVARGKAPTVLVSRPSVETIADITAREQGMEPVQDAVFRRSVAYSVTVAFSIILALLPAVDWLADNKTWQAIWARLDASVPIIDWLLKAPYLILWSIGDALILIPGWHWFTQIFVHKLLQQILDLGVAPGWVTIWLKAFANHPALFVVCALTLLWLFVRKSQQLQGLIFARSDDAWAAVRRRHNIPSAPGAQQTVAAAKRTPVDYVVRQLRTNCIFTVPYLWWSKSVMPMLFAIFVAAPVGAIMAVFFIPKFIRNASRRRKYGAQLASDRLPRIPGTPVGGAAA